MNVSSDRPGPVREGEELDAAKLEAYLRKTLGGEGPVEIEQFPAGHSNLTYLIRFGGHEYVLRRPPFGSQVKSAHDMGREYAVLSRLDGAYAPAPKPIASCDDLDVIGAPFYLMERIHGVILRVDKPEGLDVTPALARACSGSFIKNLATLHGLNYRTLGLERLRKPGQYVERQALGWSNRYANSQTDEIAEIDAVIDWLQKSIPPDSGAALIHNDYKFDNLVLDPADLTRIVGVLDWEMATIGDPLADLGSALAYWVNPGEDAPLGVTSCFMTQAGGSMTRAELAHRYARLTGSSLEHIRYYYVLGLFKLAVIVQQIYFRYIQGHTKDARFASLIDLVRLLGRRAAVAIELDHL